MQSHFPKPNQQLKSSCVVAAQRVCFVLALSACGNDAPGPAQGVDSGSGGAWNADTSRVSSSAGRSSGVSTVVSSTGGSGTAAGSARGGTTSGVGDAGGATSRVEPQGGRADSYSMKTA